MNAPSSGPGSDLNTQMSEESRVHSSDKIQPSPGREGAHLWLVPSGSPGLRIKRLQAQVVGTDLELLFKTFRAGHTGE